MSIKNEQLAKVCQTRKMALGSNKRPKLKPLPRETTHEDIAGVHDWESPPFNPYEVPPIEDEYY